MGASAIEAPAAAAYACDIHRRMKTTAKLFVNGRSQAVMTTSWPIGPG